MLLSNNLHSAWTIDLISSLAESFEEVNVFLHGFPGRRSVAKLDVEFSTCFPDDTSYSGVVALEYPGEQVVGYLE